ncbi:MAG TPA: bifunctional polysaccharide deacetylase/glycosyltransferase family 2 protein [Pseudonocardia sp.]|nr:bifunctional polysaccharide deacetylase/glycosyltransferase family 2 protein [Pseudonocardia sp.]
MWREHRPETVRQRSPRRRAVPRPRVLLIGVVFGTFVCLLGLNGLMTSEIGVDGRGAASDGPDAAVPVAISEGGPVIDLTHGRVESHVLAPKTVALSFDDGPDPVWTPQILAVLSKYRVPATFFVVGSRVARYPGLARDIRAAGSELGVHTFTHPDLGHVSAARADRELAATQLVLAGATGQATYLERPPYSSEASALDDTHYAMISRLGRRGYLTALVDVDGNDWQRPGVDAIVNSVLPVARTGGVVLLHDAGGDRSQTVAALDRLIPRLRSEGVTFTTIAAGAGLPAADFAAKPAEVALGRAMLGAFATAGLAVTAVQFSLTVVGVLVILRLLLMIVVAVRHRRTRAMPPPGAATDAAHQPIDTVTVVVPAFNEAETIAATVRSLVAGDYPVEVIVVDDGSSDRTSEVVRELALPGVQVMRQLNAGKPSALNAGILAAHGDIVVMMDGDTIFEPGTVRNLVAPFADPAVGAVAGNARVADVKSLIARWQHIEYVIGFNIDRRVQDAWQVITTVPGAVGAFRREALLEVGGVSDDTLAEDTDLTIALGRAGWRVVYQPTARAWTDAPATFGQLWRQRYRWSYGVMQSLWKHRHAVVERGPSGRLGRVGLLPAGLFQIVLPLIAPMVDVYLIYGLIFLDPLATAIAWAVVMSLQLTAGVVAFRYEAEPLRDLWLLPLQQIVYRQLMYAVLVQSVVSALSGGRLRWQKIPRAGLFSAAPLELTTHSMDSHLAASPATERGGRS